MLNNLSLLNLLIWLPITIGSLLLLYRGTFYANLFKYLAVISSFICLFLSFVLVYYFDNSTWQFQFIEHTDWLPTLGIKYALGIDGISLLLIVLTCLMSFLVLIFSFKEDLIYSIQYSAVFLIMQGLLCGVFSSLDAILFFMFFEGMLIPMFLIIGVWGGKNRIYATIKFFLFTVVGSVSLLISLIYLLVKLNGIEGMDSTFSMLGFQQLSLTINEQKWLFWGLFIAFAIKLPIIPVHTWLPDAHVEAPTGGSVILAAIILKIGGYGILRFILPVIPEAYFSFSNILFILGLVSIGYIGLITIIQKDLKKLIAYSSIAHMSLVLLGVFAISKSNLNIQSFVIGIEGAILQMLAHGLIVAALFFSAGVIYKRTNSMLIADHKGLASYMPKLAVFFMIFSLANIGLPGAIGFVGEFFILLATVKIHFLYALWAGMILILSVAYMMWTYKNIMFGESGNVTDSRILKNKKNMYTWIVGMLSREEKNIVDDKVVFSKKDLYWNEVFVFITFGIIIILFGFWPEPILNIMSSSVEHLGKVILK